MTFCFSPWYLYLVLLFFSMAMVSRFSCFFNSRIVLGRCKPAVKQNVSGCNTCTLCGMDQLHHNICGFPPCLAASPSCKGPAIIRFPPTKQVLVIRCGKQAVADRQERVPSDHPNVSSRNPERYFMEQWSKTLASSSTFLDRERSKRLSSTIKTSFRSSPVNGFMKRQMISAESKVVKRCQLTRASFRKR